MENAADSTPKLHPQAEHRARAPRPPERLPPSPPTGIATVPPRALALSFLLFVLLFAALLVVETLIGTSYSRLFRAMGNAMVGLGSHGTVWFAQPEVGGEHDTELVVVDPANRVQRRTQLSSHRHAYLPTAFFVALALATPVRWGMRLRCLAWGLLALHVYFALKFFIFPLAYGPGTDAPWTLAAGLRSVLWVLGATTVGWSLVPVFLWLLLVFVVPARRR